MKKLILCGAALLLSLGITKAQGLSATGAHDDFQQLTEYNNLTWAVDAAATSQITLTRAVGGMTLSCTAGANLYAYFAANFVTPVNCQTNSKADVTVTIKNKSLTETLFIGITLIDANGIQANFEPDITDVTATTLYGDNTGSPNFYYHRKALNGFTLAANTTQTIKITMAAAAAPINLCGLTPNDNDGNGTPNNCDGQHPFTCPETAHLIDPTQIVGVFFAPNFGTSDINLSEGDGNPVADTYIPGNTITQFVGDFEITDFKFGSTVPTITGIAESQIDASLSVYPNPAKESLTVSFNAASGSTVSLSNMTGKNVYSTSAIAGSNDINVNTSDLSSGMYILSITTDNGKVVRKVTIK